MILDSELVIACDSCGVKIHAERLTPGGARLAISEYGWVYMSRLNRDLCPKCSAKRKETNENS